MLSATLIEALIEAGCGHMTWVELNYRWVKGGEA